MKPIHALSIICLCFVIFSCKKDSGHSGYIDENEALVEDLTEVEGNSRTYNFDFKIVEYPTYGRAHFYRPIDIEEALDHIPEEMKDAIHLPNIGNLPFTPGTSKANIVTYWNDKNTLIFQIQISYFSNSSSYDADENDFLVISATLLEDNPFIDTSSTNDPIDKWREDFNVDGTDGPEDIVIYRELELTPDLPLFFKNHFQHWSTMYAYYSYDDANDEIKHRSAGAKIYYAWHNSVLFQIGYKHFDNPDIDMEPIVRQIILGS